MRRFSRYFVVLFLAIAAGCASPDTTMFGTSSAYGSYSRVRKDVEPTTVVAMMAYASSTYARTACRSWNEVRSTFNYMALDMESNGQVHNNYPIVPNKAELALFRQITNKWVDKMASSGLSVRKGPEQFNAAAAEFIFRIQRDEYVTPSL